MFSIVIRILNCRIIKLIVIRLVVIKLRSVCFCCILLLLCSSSQFGAKAQPPKYSAFGFEKDLITDLWSVHLLFDSQLNQTTKSCKCCVKLFLSTYGLLITLIWFVIAFILKLINWRIFNQKNNLFEKFDFLCKCI